MDTIEIPDEIIENILIRLPVKSLLRFKAVSRNFKATMSDPVFARKHLKSSTCRQYIFIEEVNQFQRENEKFKLVEIKNQETQVQLKLDYPGELKEASFMCYLDGVILLRCYREISWSLFWMRFYALWNFSTGTFIKFPYSNSIGFSPIIYGFCYDSLAEDYKVVMGNEVHYAIFNCREERWTRRKELPINIKGCSIKPQGVCFNGSLYWVLNKYPFHKFNFQIVRFDSKDDKFKMVSGPKGIQNNYKLDLILLGGHLCLYYNPTDQLLIMKKDDDRDSWMEFMTIDIKSWIVPVPLFMTDENEIILETWLRSGYTMSHYYTYNSSKKTFVEIINNSRYIGPFVFRVVESLVLGTENNKRVRRQQRAFQEVFFFMKDLVLKLL